MVAESQIARNVGEIAEDVIDVRGHWLYVRKCTSPEMVGEIALPEMHIKDSQYVEVIAVGSRVGHRCTKRWATYYKDAYQKDRPRHMVRPVNPGDLVLCPNGPSVSIKASPFFVKKEPYEFFIEESWPIAVLEGELPAAVKAPPMVFPENEDL